MKSSYDLINNKTVQKDEDMNLPSRRQHPHPHQRSLLEAVYQWRFQKTPDFTIQQAKCHVPYDYIQAMKTPKNQANLNNHNHLDRAFRGTLNQD